MTNLFFSLLQEPLFMFHMFCLFVLFFMKVFATCYPVSSCRRLARLGLLGYTLKRGEDKNARIGVEERLQLG